MKLNEIRRIQQLAGILKENEELTGEINVDSVINSPEVIAISKKLENNIDVLKSTVSQLKKMGIDTKVLDQAADAHLDHKNVNSIINTDTPLDEGKDVKKIAILIAAVILALSTTSCRVQNGFSFFHPHGSGAYCPRR